VTHYSSASDADRSALRDSVRGFLATHGSDWDRMAKELGLQGLGLPESVGGTGYGPAELAVVHEELGRVLDDSPFFATVALAAPALFAAGDTAYLPGIASGETVASVALQSDVTAAGGRLTGRCERVLAGAEANLLLVPAGGVLYAVTGEEGVARTALHVLDASRPQARIDLSDAPARLVAPDAPSVFERTRVHAAVALAAEQVGTAQAALDMAVDYAKTRVQFGRVIGSFQAVKHLLVDLATELELARSAAEEATLAAATGDPRLPMLASIAQATCSEALVHIAEESIQIHGGIGVTWEHPAHLYFRRATFAEAFLGSPAEHRRTIARLLVQSLG